MHTFLEVGWRALLLEICEMSPSHTWSAATAGYLSVLACF